MFTKRMASKVLGPESPVQSLAAVASLKTAPMSRVLMRLGEPCGDWPVFGQGAQIQSEDGDAGGGERRVEGALGGGDNSEGMHAGCIGHIDGPERALVEGKAKIHDLRAEKAAQTAHETVKAKAIRREQ